MARKLWFDGGCRPNPGRMECAVVARGQTWFVPDCGQPCSAGTTCFSCITKPTMFAACTTMCADSNACADPTLPLCQMGMSGNTSGKFCTASNVTCDTK